MAMLCDKHAIQEDRGFFAILRGTKRNGKLDCCINDYRVAMSFRELVAFAVEGRSNEVGLILTTLAIPMR